MILIALAIAAMILIYESQQASASTPSGPANSTVAPSTSTANPVSTTAATAVATDTAAPTAANPITTYLAANPSVVSALQQVNPSTSCRVPYLVAEPGVTGILGSFGEAPALGVQQTYLSAGQVLDCLSNPSSTFGLTFGPGYVATVTAIQIGASPASPEPETTTATTTFATAGSPAPLVSMDIAPTVGDVNVTSLVSS